MRELKNTTPNTADDEMYQAFVDCYGGDGVTAWLTHEDERTYVAVVELGLLVEINEYSVDGRLSSRVSLTLEQWRQMTAAVDTVITRFLAGAR